MCRSGNKGQVAMEFVILVATAMVILVIYMFLNLESHSEFAEQREYAALNDALNMVRTEIDTATTVSDGYMRVFGMPLTIDSRDYNITRIGDVIILTGEYTSASLRMPMFSGTLTKGDNVLTRENGQITLN